MYKICKNMQKYTKYVNIQKSPTPTGLVWPPHPGGGAGMGAPPGRGIIPGSFLIERQFLNIKNTYIYIYINMYIYIYLYVYIYLSIHMW